MLAYQVWSKDREESSSEEEDDEDGEKLYRSKPKKPAKFSMGPWEANNLKTTLRLTESVQEIMTWSLVKVHGILSTIRSERTSWELDYGKLLVFVSGNLDEAFSSAMATDDCDTDADVYHEMTKKITIADIKSALTRRFRPEQVARLGNNHIIYPSLSKDSYQKLIRSSCEKYVSEMTEISGINFTLDEKLFKEIYDKCLHAWNSYRAGEKKLNLKYYPEVDSPKPR
jgi:cell division protease FtsH